MWTQIFSKKGAKTVDAQAEQTIQDILTRGVEDVFVREHLEKQLRSGKKLRVKLGIDPTGKNVHLGNAVILWKLRAFQDLGHQVVLIVGDFTARIGDSSDKLDKRPMLSSKQVQENLLGYKKQLGKIIDLSRAEIVYNSKWLSKLTFDEICQLAETFSVQQMINRRNFKDRIDAGVEISLREFMYPLMQGYDSVMVRADVELGGFDQLFNLKAGRVIQKHYGQPEQDIMTCKMLFGTDGRKMSKSWGNVINVTDTPDEMFGKTMSVRDELMADYFLLCTDMSVADAQKIGARIEAGESPRDIKLSLAERIVARYWGEKAGADARAKFIDVFSEKKIPDDVPTANVNPGTLLMDVALAQGAVASKTEWRRSVEGNAVTDGADGTVVVNPNRRAENKIYKIGKRRFVKVSLNS